MSAPKWVMIILMLRTSWRTKAYQYWATTCWPTASTREIIATHFTVNHKDRNSHPISTLATMIQQCKQEANQINFSHKHRWELQWDNLWEERREACNNHAQTNIRLTHNNLGAIKWWVDTNNLQQTNIFPNQASKFNMRHLKTQAWFRMKTKNYAKFALLLTLIQSVFHVVIEPCVTNVPMTSCAQQNLALFAVQ